MPTNVKNLVPDFFAIGFSKYYRSGPTSKVTITCAMIGYSY